MSVADRIAVMHRGRIEQLGSPVALYDKPATLFVASFIGTTNQLAGTIVAAVGGNVTLRLDAGAELAVSGPTLPIGARALLSVRPEQLVLADSPGPGRFPVTLGLAVPLGGQANREAVTRDGVVLRLTETCG